MQKVQSILCVSGDKEVGKCISRRLGLATMAQDYFKQIDAAAVMTQRSETSHAPKRSGEELGLHRAVPAAFVEIRPEIVTLEIGVDILDYERLPVWHHQGRIAGSVIHFVEQCGRSGKQAIENPFFGVINRIYVGHATIMIDCKILNVASRAPQLIEDLRTVLGAHILLVNPGFEIVEQVELEVIDESGIDLV